MDLLRKLRNLTAVQNTNSTEEKNNVELYHYTNERATISIFKSGRIRSSQMKPGYSTIGIGVFLTSIPPTSDKASILANNYNDDVVIKRFNDRADYYFKINSANFPGIIKTGTSRDIWLYPYDIKLDDVVECGETFETDDEYLPLFSYERCGNTMY
ncbi:hypothetical protein CHUAL_011052 [Chamberlinius hualienensis]